MICRHCTAMRVNGRIIHEGGCPTLGNPNDSRSKAYKSKKALEAFYRSDEWKNRPRWWE
jgi:hypothetical protein